MTVVSKASAERRLFPNHLCAAVVGLLASALVMVAALRIRGYTGATYPLLVLCVFPVPVACGGAAGVLAPRRALVWAPIWACIIAAITFAILASEIGVGSTIMPIWRILAMSTGLAVAAVSAYGVERHVGSQMLWKGTAALILLCALTAGAGQVLAFWQMRAFQRDVVPQVLAELADSYLGVPRQANWTVARYAAHECYELSTAYRGERLRLFVTPEVPEIIGIEWHYTKGHALADDGTAHEYLAALGFRGRLLTSLSRQKGRSGSWCAGLQSTRLTLSHNGSITLEPYPRFDQRTEAADSQKRAIGPQ